MSSAVFSEAWGRRRSHVFFGRRALCGIFATPRDVVSVRPRCVACVRRVLEREARIAVRERTRIEAQVAHSREVANLFHVGAP